MYTLDFIRERSRRKEFPLEACSFGVLCLLGAPIVLPPILIFVAVDAVVSAIMGAPSAIGTSVAAPGRMLTHVQRAVTDRAETRRRELEAEERKRQEQADRFIREQAAELGMIDARGEVIRFYEFNRAFVEDALPPALFRAQLWNRFPGGETRDKAWQTAQAMIAEMLPLVAAGRERRRTEEADAKKIADQVAAEEKTKRDEENSRHAVGRLTQWYEREKSRIEELMPDSPERDIILQQLYERFDQLVKETILEMKP